MYNESHDEIYGQILSIQELNLVDPNANSSFDSAMQEYSLSTFYKEKDMLEDAVDHLLLVEYHIDEALVYELSYWKTESQELIEQVELKLEKQSNIEEAMDFFRSQGVDYKNMEPSTQEVLKDKITRAHH